MEITADDVFLTLLMLLIYSEKYAPESILTFAELIKVIQIEEELTIFLLVAPRNNAVVAKLNETLRNKDVGGVGERIIYCSRSPLIIYQVRTND